MEVYQWLAAGPATASRMAVALQLASAEDWPAGPDNHAQMSAAVAQTTLELPGLSREQPPLRRDPRPQGCSQTEPPLRVFSDSAAVQRCLSSPRFLLVEDRAQADVLFLVSHVRDFLGLPTCQLVSQFPYEGGLVRKDLLPQTIRRSCYAEGSHQWLAPRWWPDSFDLATESHFFLAEFGRRAASSQPNIWIVKAAQGSHAEGYTITRDASEVCALVLDPPGGADQVSQLYIEKPLTLRGRKFDLRIFVAVKAFAPEFEGYFHPYYYGRLAAEPWEVLAADADLTQNGVHFTTHAGRANLDPEQLAAQALQDGLSVATWEKALADCRGALTELFVKCGPQIGEWPRSRGYYGCDLMLEAGEVLVPKLLEVNFQADLELVGATSGEPKLAQLVNELFETLFTDDVPSCMMPLKLELVS